MKELSELKNEFYEVMKESGNIGLILKYPDLVNGKRSDWATSKPQIAKDLDFLMKYKHWGMVATHNPNGEYGHIHHKMTSKLRVIIRTAGEIICIILKDITVQEE